MTPCGVERGAPGDSRASAGHGGRQGPGWEPGSGKGRCRGRDGDISGSVSGPEDGPLGEQKSEIWLRSA